MATWSAAFAPGDRVYARKLWTDRWLRAQVKIVSTQGRGRLYLLPLEGSDRKADWYYQGEVQKDTPSASRTLFRPPKRRGRPPVVDTARERMAKMRAKGAVHLMDIYSERAAVVAALARAARELGCKVWFGVDPKEPEWPVLFVDLPTGQVSWHFSEQDRAAYASDIPNGRGKWDGHSTEEKYQRLQAWLTPRRRRTSRRKR